MTTVDVSLVGEACFRRLADQYYDRLGLDWRRRGRMLEGINADFPALEAWDMRMCAAVDALAHLGEPSAVRTLASLAEPACARDVFAATVQAAVAREPDLFAACVALAESLPSLRLAHRQAADWISPEVLNELMCAWPRRRSSGAMSDVWLLFGLACLRRPELGDEAQEWAKPLIAEAAERPCTQAALLDLARHRGWSAWGEYAEDGLTKSDGYLQFACVAYLLIFGSAHQRRKAFDHGASLALQPGIHGDAVAGLLVAEDDEASVRLISALQRTPALQTRYVDSLAWHGNPRAVELLIPLLDQAPHARRAAATITALTGSDPRRDGWQADEPPQPLFADDALPASDAERGWPWPEKAAFQDWWAKHAARFDPVHRYVLGHVCAPAALKQQLAHAALRWRPLAAWRLQRLTRTRAVSTDLPAASQRLILTRLAESQHERA